MYVRYHGTMRKVSTLMLLLLVAALHLSGAYNVKRLGTNGVKHLRYSDDDKNGNIVGVNNLQSLVHETNEPDRNNIYTQSSFMQSSAFLANMMHDREHVLSRNPITYSITGVVKGITEGQPISVALGAQYSNVFDSLEVKTLTASNPYFKFTVTSGRYYIRTLGAMYMTPSAIRINVPCQKCKYVNSFYSDIIEVSPYENDPSTFLYEWELQTSAPIASEHINTVHNDDAEWSHGHDLSNDLKLDGSAAAASLKTFYGVELTGVWGSEYADRLLTVLASFPECVKLVTYDKEERSKQRKHQKWILVNGDLGAFDMDIEEAGEEDNSEYSKIVRVSKNAFEYSKKSVINPGSNGIYFSRRLEKVILRALFSLDYELFFKYFEQKHGVMLLDPMRNHGLLENITGYSYNDYQPWQQNVEELVELATSWDEYPTGFQKVKGLKYLVRRKNGLKHPVYPTAPAVAFPSGSDVDSFIEFMESAFVNYKDISHLILHEIGHFIYVNMLSGELKKEWITLGQWYEEPLAPSEWATKDEVGFVSAYAHDKTPGEDFAESIAAFVLNGRLLNSRSPPKYSWIKKSLFKGSFYVTSGTHKFEVLNLGNAVYYFPGKVKKIKAQVLGSSTEDKIVKIEISLLSSKGNVGCAKNAYARFFSEQQTYRDVFFFTNNNSECSHNLYAEFVINSSESRGRWVAESLTFTGQNDIKRYTGLGSFLIYLYVNNQNEDIEKPLPLLDSVTIYPHNGVGSEDSLLRLNILVLEDSMLKIHGGTYASFASHDNESYSYGNHTYSAYDPEFNVQKLKNDYFVNDITTSGFRQVNMESCSAHTNMDVSNLKCFQVMNPVRIPQHCIGGRYYFRQFSVDDEAGNQNILNVSTDKHFADLRPSGVRDMIGPVVSNVKVTSQPANDQHDGETLVTLDFFAYDDLSGMNYIYVNLRDPHGGVHPSYVAKSALPMGRQNRKIVHVISLPKGSMAGTWLLEEIKAVDMCNNETRNVYTYSVFVENS
ncbi:sporozoite invasion-associated protein 1, putative [Plasmodium ovale]|uniref:Sporozoite invasion-associated protein 1, putative n=2 Tax=Plasmodium ovale TaxID=36330 RepID=A0A1C3KN42_PLAOA|nr:sporozoite invasion-associated protein 1, putative [Plasmodium ovale]